MRRCSALLSSLLLALSACGGGSREEGSISRERFVATSVALRTARFPRPLSAVTPEDSAKARADSARVRAAVLKRHGVTVQQLQRFVEARRNHTEELAEVWKEIADRVARADSTAKAGSAKGDSLAGRSAPDAGAAPIPPPAQTPAPSPGGPPTVMPDPGPPPQAMPPRDADTVRRRSGPKPPGQP